MRQVRIRVRRADRRERLARRYADQGRCTKCALAGNHDEPAEYGQLCKRHFDEATGRAA